MLLTKNQGCGSDDDSNNTVIVVAEDDDDTNSDTITITITITDAGVSIDSGQTANLLESAADDTDVITLTTSGDTPTLFAINGGNRTQYSQFRQEE